MKLDDDVCLCFHVTRRKVIQYIRVKKPAVPSQLSECFGAGTGCGWCRPYLERIFQTEQSGCSLPPDDDLPESSAYSKARSVYRAKRPAAPPAPPAP